MVVLVDSIVGVAFFSHSSSGERVVPMSWTVWRSDWDWKVPVVREVNNRAIGGGDGGGG